MQLSKKNILRFFKDNPGTTHFADLLREFGGRHVKRELKALLDDMANDGEMVRLKGNSYTLPSAITTVQGRLSLHRDGYGFLTPAQGGDDIFIPARHTKGALHGDQVEAVTSRSRQGGNRLEGRITAIRERGVSRIVGRYEETSRGGIVIADDTRLNLTLGIPITEKGRAGDGQQVVADITHYPVGGRPALGRITEVLGWPDDPEVEIQSVIRRFDLPHEFSAEALAEAETIPEQVQPGELNNRTDLRDRLTVTIDGETAKDFDDAVSLVREGNRYRLWVSIADVSAYVTQGSALDRDAYLRGTSVYFPDRCIPMLPERLSNGICSLNPQVDRLTMTAEMLFDESGAMVESSFYPSIIRSSYRLTYTIVRQIIVDDDREAADKLRPVTPMLLEMKQLALILMAMRKQRGSIDFDLPEPEIIIGATGQTEGIIRAERTLANQVIEEFMLAANEAVARFITRRNIPFLYRIHEHPDLAKLQQFQEFIQGFGYDLPLVADRVNPKELQRLLLQTDGKPEQRMLNYALLRCMKQARYAAENLGHFGLASDCYCHFTSPIRRYPDLVVHRILKAALVLADNPASDTAVKGLGRATENLGQVGEHTSSRERVAMEAERDVVEMKKLQYMQRHLGESFDGFISGVASFGFFVELTELFVEGMVHISTLPDDYYTYLENRHSLVGQRQGITYRIGDPVRVTVAAVNPAERRIEFVIATNTVSKGPVPSPAELYQKIPVRGKRPSRPTDKKSGNQQRPAGPARSKGKTTRQRRRG